MVGYMVEIRKRSTPTSPKPSDSTVTTCNSFREPWVESIRNPGIVTVDRPRRPPPRPASQAPILSRGGPRPYLDIKPTCEYLVSQYSTYTRGALWTGAI